MNECKTIHENYLCPLKFAFKLIKSKPSKLVQIILIFFIIEVLFAILSIGAFFINDILGYTLISLFSIIFGALSLSYSIHIAKIFTKNIDEATEIYIKTPVSKFFEENRDRREVLWSVGNGIN
ncbi:MAG: hypothetical protein DSY66_02975 [Persephonella sp.]|nr:MAG: hypothetical protein DSY66_02975 [Persephonella sp.]